MYDEAIVSGKGFRVFDTLHVVFGTRIGEHEFVVYICVGIPQGAHGAVMSIFAGTVDESQASSRTIVNSIC